RKREPGNTRAQADEGAESDAPLFSYIARAGDAQRAANRTESHEREQIAISFRTAMENIFHEHGKVSAHGHAQTGHAEGQNNQRFHRILLARELNALLQAGEDRLRGLHW